MLTTVVLRRRISVVLFLLRPLHAAYLTPSRENHCRFGNTVVSIVVSVSAVISVSVSCRVSFAVSSSHCHSTRHMNIV